VDLVDIGRWRRALQRSPSLINRHFSKREIQYAAQLGARRKGEFLAGRMAAKEACLKALGIGLEAPWPLSDLEVIPDASGAPCLVLHASALACAARLGCTQFAVSLSHEAGLAIALVVLS